MSDGENVIRSAEFQQPNKYTINVGSRNSQLALIQTRKVVDSLDSFCNKNLARLKDICPEFEHGIEFNIVGMSTTGDRILDKALPQIGSKSLFTKELEVALLEEKVDFVVHSLKDLPTTLPQGCVIGAIMRRSNPDDAIVLKESLRQKVDPMEIIFRNESTDSAGGKYRIGTSSRRRIALLKNFNPQVECIDIRGNLNTRLGKLDRDEGEYDAIILAKAGLDRMGWKDRASCVLTPETDRRLDSWCYAVGQGALAVESRLGDQKIVNLLSAISDLKTTYEAIAERSLMKKLEGGCSVPLGVRSAWNGNVLNLKAVVLSVDGSSLIQSEDRIDLDEANTSQLDNENLSKIDGIGVCISNKLIDVPVSHVQAKLIRCMQLGESLADKIVALGGLELIRSIR